MSSTPKDIHIFPTLKTAHLVLRKLAPKDVTEVTAMRSDDEVNKFLDRPKSVTMEEAQNFIDKITALVDSGESYYWAITLTEMDILIGTVCLWHLEPEKQRAEIGYELQPAWQGMGLMQEAVKAVMQFAFEELNYKILLACFSSENIKSKKLLER